MNNKKIINIALADYQNHLHQLHIPFLLNQYAIDPMGGGHALSQEVKRNLVSELAKLSFAFSIIAYVDNKPAGLVNCFEGFSTFTCQPLINIHDLVVLAEFRGLGISQMMLDKVESLAIEKGCVKLTLEVLSNNEIAKAAYLKYGFAGYELNPAAGQALFWQKKLLAKK